MNERHDGLPTGSQDRHERRRRDRLQVKPRRPRHSLDVARGRPLEKACAEDEKRRGSMNDEGAVRHVVEQHVVMPLGARPVDQALAMEPIVYRVGTDRAAMELAPDLSEADVVLAPTERARAVPCGERRDLVEKEELGEAARLQEGITPPASEAESARDPGT